MHSFKPLLPPPLYEQQLKRANQLEDSLLQKTHMFGSCGVWGTTCSLQIDADPTKNGADVAIRAATAAVLMLV